LSGDKEGQGGDDEREEERRAEAEPGLKQVVDDPAGQRRDQAGGD
jgi:hypothetical protein